MELTHFDAAEHITEPEDQAELLADALATGDAKVIAGAIGIVARARGMSDIARETGMNRQQLYRAFGKDGNPTLSTVMAVLKALDLRMTVQRAEAA